jgi:hypothetical protein
LEVLPVVLALRDGEPERDEERLPVNVFEGVTDFDEDEERLPVNVFDGVIDLVDDDDRVPVNVFEGVTDLVDDDDRDPVNVLDGDADADDGTARRLVDAVAEALRDIVTVADAAGGVDLLLLLDADGEALPTAPMTGHTSAGSMHVTVPGE